MTSRISWKLSHYVLRWAISVGARTMASVLVCTIPLGYGAAAQGAFTTVISSPPHDLNDYRLEIGSDTQLNIYQGATLKPYNGLRYDRRPVSNVEINLLGGVLEGELFSSGYWEPNTNVVINILSGKVASVGADNGNTVNVLGGEITDYLSIHNSKATISGGSIGRVNAAGDSRLNLVGGEFRLNGVPIAGLQTAGNSAAVNLGDQGVLTGTLADGTRLIVA